MLSSSWKTNSIAASGWSAADARHGPLGQVIPGAPVIFLIASPGGRDSVESFAAGVESLGGIPLVVDDSFSGLSYPGLDPALIPLLEIIPLRQMALELAVARGLGSCPARGANEGDTGALAVLFEGPSLRISCLEAFEKSTVPR